ncbi:hypothetical protein SS50377_26927 [Spironucleus salmonicida]|uniref:Thioredoxin domain-containing protein n=1 Tax=Spironucleus salmonicida TaxID=348837 RepID=V6LT53_9EUKA|nr:hypothetical protein SS50377_26927 [Spironucleus salmonicida]|eukprot:EST47438.1 Hypothetical protein SS50377_12423 [Spironucleus salmonicida]
MILFAAFSLQFTTPAKIKRAAALNTSFVTIYTKHDSKSSTLLQEELETIESDFAPYKAYAVNCSAKNCSQSIEFPAIYLYNSNQESPAPIQYFGESDSDQILDWVVENVRNNFVTVKDTDEILQLLLQIQEGLLGGNFLILTCKTPEIDWFYYEFADRMRANNIQLVVQNDFSFERFQAYQKVNFFDKLDEDGVNAIIIFGGNVNFYPWEHLGSLFIGGNEQMLDEWVGEVVKILKKDEI